MIKMNANGIVSNMMNPRHPRDFGGRFKIHNPDDSTPIREMFRLGKRLLFVTDKCTYAMQIADQVDPGRANPALPHNVQQKISDHGIESELLCRSLLHSKVMFRKEFLQINIEIAMQLAFEAFSELTSMQAEAQSYKVLELTAPFLQMVRNARDCLEHRNVTGAITSDFTLQADGNVAVPSIEINFRGSIVDRCSIAEFMTGATRSLLDTFEMITVHMCGKNMQTFAGMPMKIAPVNDEIRATWHTRFAYGACYNGKFAPCG